MNDIALIRVQDSMQFNVAVGPACLPVQYKQANFYDAHVVALGKEEVENYLVLKKYRVMDGCTRFVLNLSILRHIVCHASQV